MTTVTTLNLENKIKSIKSNHLSEIGGKLLIRET